MGWKSSLIGALLLTGLVSTAVSAETVYSVREGDTLETIAAAHRTTVADVEALNPHLQDKGFAPGLVLLLPDNLSAELARQQRERVTDPIMVAGVLHDPPKASIVPVTAEQRAKLEEERRHKSMASRRGKMVRSISQTAKSWMGTPYLMGGTTRRAVDCSAYTQNVFAKHGFKIPRTADVQYYKVGTKVPKGQEQPGDLVFFETYLPGPSHVGIYMGNGQFIHASSSRGVTITPLSSNYFGPRYLGAKRVF